MHSESALVDYVLQVIRPGNTRIGVKVDDVNASIVCYLSDCLVILEKFLLVVSALRE